MCLSTCNIKAKPYPGKNARNLNIYIYIYIKHPVQTVPMQKCIAAEHMYIFIHIHSCILVYITYRSNRTQAKMHRI